MNALDKAICTVAPRVGARRLQARLAIRAAQTHLREMHYDAATSGRRSSSLRASSADADAASGRRARIAYVSRDMLRNNPWATRAKTTIAGHVVGDGIVPKLVGGSDALRAEWQSLLETHLETVSLDPDGRQNLFGMQGLAAGAMVSDGECLIVPSFSQLAARKGEFPLKLRVLEADYLDTTRSGFVQGNSGNTIFDGIEYDTEGNRVAYWLYDEHPGTAAPKKGQWSLTSKRYDAKFVIHLFRQDRPGQQRGVSWFAPVVLSMQDLADYQDAQILRQKIAACFTAFRKRADALPADKDPVKKLSPGAIVDLGPDEEITFGSPPETSGLDEFTRTVLRSIAVGMGITYESLTGDLAQVNFSSARMGRMDMDRNISAWQRLVMIPQMLQRIGDWIKMAWALQNPARAREINALRIEWTPPHRIIVDPAREIPALKEAVRSGFQTRRGVQRSFGIDPERILQEQIEEQAEAETHKLVFDSDASKVSNTGVTQARPAGSVLPKETDDE